MHLHRKDVDAILDILARFPEMETFKLEQDSSSGIGSVTTMSFNTEINGVDGIFAVEIAGVEDW